jgi:predicted ATPase/transcriptional regulator with XRE-family HTH domain
MVTSRQAESFGGLLQRYRAAAGLSQEELADRAGLSRRGISDLERGVRRSPYPATVRRLAAALGLAEADRRVLLGAARTSSSAAVASAVSNPDASRNLPVERTSFVGRAYETVAIRRQLAGTRLLTLTGPGGSGKTRLAVQVAGELVDSFADGVFFVPLAPLADPTLIPATIAQVLGVRETGGRSHFDELKECLRTKQTLLVLDNFEHLLAAAPLVGEMLDDCPGLSALITSRTLLRLAREHVFEVPPMPAPEPGGEADLEASMRYDAVRLFVERARAAQHNFALTASNARSVTEICRHVDGLPLAIELAAARTRLFEPGALIRQLSNRLDLLTNGPRDGPSRHQTLRSALTWSYELLMPAERRLFERLAVFAGGFTLHAAEAVADADGSLGISTLDALASLVDQSLLNIIQLEEQPVEPRFVLLETMREFAMERLVATGDVLDTRTRHSEYFRALAESVQPRLQGPLQAESLTRLDPEHDNLRAALSWCIAQRHEEHALRFSTALMRYWQMRGHITEGRERMSEVLGIGVPGAGGAIDSHSALRANALDAAGFLSWLQLDNAVAQPLYEQSLMIRRTIEDRQGIASCLNHLGNVARDRGETGEACRLYEESAAILRELGNRRGLAVVLSNLGEVTQFARDCAAAQSFYSDSLAIGYELEDGWCIGNSIQGLADVAQQQGNYEVARQLYEQSLAMVIDVKDRSGIPARLEGFAGLAAADNRLERAVRLAGAAARLRASVGGPRRPPEEELFRLWMRPTEALSHPAAEAAWAEGQAMSDEQVVAYALEPETGHAQPTLRVIASDRRVDPPNLASAKSRRLH